jgi:hypothetical protein
MLEFFLKGNYDVTKRIRNKLKEIAKEGNRNALEGYNKTKEGYVYLITNPAWKGWVKVGMAVDAEDRCNSFQTSSPYRDYQLEYCGYFQNRRVAEGKVHKKISKISEDIGSEWFKISVIDAINVVEKVMYGR